MANAENPELVAKFRDIFGEAPELTQPLSVSDDEEGIPLTLKSITGKIGAESATFFGQHPSSDLRAQVDYQMPYKLKLCRKQLFTSRFGEDNNLNGGQIAYNFGEATLFYNIPGNSFGGSYYPELSINLNNVQAPPLVEMHYSKGSFPWEAIIIGGEWDELVNGRFLLKKRKAYGQTRYDWRKTRISIGSLSGIFATEENPNDDQDFSGLKTNKLTINDQEMTTVGGYDYGIRYHRDRFDNQWGRGRLSFFRVNTDTKSLWEIRVPEWIDREDFISHATSDQWDWCTTSYPFWLQITEPGQPPKSLGSKF